MNRFDELAKALAGSATRRQALRAISGGVLAALGLGTTARAGHAWGEECEDYCKSLDAHPLGQCVSSCVACVKGGGQACGVDNCCSSEENCCSTSGACIPACSERQMFDPESCLCVCATAETCARDEVLHPDLCICVSAPA
jgi:hypothetical protein